jgi:hypothetical protein
VLGTPVAKDWKLKPAFSIRGITADHGKVLHFNFGDVWQSWIPGSSHSIQELQQSIKKAPTSGPI